ncbi:MAG: PrgI family protein [Oscillospiraceae bacterium]|jgi:hypothetical protein|nr:PrgI family protein [Oscillospiraceae bacterium]
MPYVQIPKDLTRVKPKILLNLTKRQLICFSLAAAVGLPFYFLTKGAIGTSFAALGMLVIMLPCFFAAMYEKDGQPFEKIVITYITARYLRKRTRPYKTQNIYAYLQNETDTRKEEQRLAKAQQPQSGKARKGASSPKRKSQKRKKR